MTTEETGPTGTVHSARVFGVIGVLATVAAIALGAIAVLGGPEQPVLEVFAATAADDADPAPSSPTDDSATSDAAGPRVAPAPDTTVPAGRASSTTAVTPTTTTTAPTTTTSVPAPAGPPVAVETDRIDLSGYPVRSVGLEENGELEVPDETEIGWYEYGASPGESGVTVLAAHVSWNRQLGPFAKLGTMEPGDTIYVTVADGSVEPYVVTEVTMYPKDELPSERLWRNVGDESLALITCGGRFDDSINRFRDNIVVYASPTDDPSSGTAPSG